ncbi:MAG: hypothetical protein NVS3B25_19260 [Hymenobacter sp.]
MTTHPLSSTPTAIPLSGEPTARTPEEQQVRALAKVQKRERKWERLRFFFGWCEGCRAFGEGF